MSKNLKTGLGAAFLIIVVGMLLVGCGDFRRQAQDAQTRLDEAVQRAEIAEEAAARNAGRIIELEHRIESLEESLAELQETEPND